MPLVIPFAPPPDSELVAAVVCDCRVRLDEMLGAQNDRACAIADVLDLRIDALNLDAEVLLQRQPHGVVDRQRAPRFGRLRRCSLGRRLNGAAQAQLSTLAESGHGHRDDSRRDGGNPGATN